MPKRDLAQLFGVAFGSEATHYNLHEYVPSYSGELSGIFMMFSKCGFRVEVCVTQAYLSVLKCPAIRCSNQDVGHCDLLHSRSPAGIAVSSLDPEYTRVPVTVWMY